MGITSLFKNKDAVTAGASTVMSGSHSSDSKPSFLKRCFNTAVKAAGVFVAGGALKAVYQELTGNKINIDLNFKDDNKIGIEHIKKTVDVGNSSRVQAFNYVGEATPAANDQEFE